MKSKNYLILAGYLIFGILRGYSQCDVTAKGDTTINCGGSVQLVIEATGGTPDLITWSPSNSLSANNIADPVANPTSTTTYTVTITTGACTAIDSVTVTVNAFTADAGNNKSLICGGSVQLDNVSTNYTGSGSLTYFWTPATGLSAVNVPNPTVTIKQTTTYYVTVTTSNGCTATDSVTVTVDPLKANAGNDKILSCGNTVQLDQVSSNYTGSGTLSYSWSPATGLNSAGIANPTATIKQTTNYAVTVTTPDGCTATDTVTVFVGPLTVNAGNDKTISCGGNVSLGITTNYSGSNGALTYAWTPSTGLNLSYIANPTASPIQSTKYYITVTTPSGCTATDSVFVKVDPLTADAGPDKSLICGGQAQLQVLTNYTGNGSASYLWTPSNGLNLSNIANPVASVIQNTSFIVTVTTQNGCMAKDTVMVAVNPLIANAGADMTLTCGSEGQLQVTSNYTGSGNPNYAWTPSSGLNLSNIANPIVSVTQTTTFYAMVTTDNGCKAVDTILVFVNPLTVNAGSDKTHICGGSVQLDSALTNYTGGGTLTYIWLPKTGLNNAGIPNPVSNSPGVTYTLTISSPYGACQASDQVNVSIAPLAADEICLVTVDTSGNNIILWNKPESPLLDSFLIYRETSITGNYLKIASVQKNALTSFKDMTSKPDAGSSRYMISLKDTCGIESARSAAHKTMFLSVAKGAAGAWSLSWEGYEGFPVSSYIIYRGTTPKNMQFLDATAGTNNQYIDLNPPAGDVYYQLEVIRPTVCSPTNPANASRSNIASSNKVGVDEMNDGFRFSVYPNPSNETIYINVEKGMKKGMSVNIYNSIGALIKAVVMDQNNQQIDVSDLSNGLYTIELKTFTGASKQKLIIQR